MFKDQCVSVTELRTKTKKHLAGIKKGEKYIFVNNKPIAVLVDIHQYELLMSKPMLQDLPENETTPRILASAKKAKRMNKSELFDL